MRLFVFSFICNLLRAARRAMAATCRCTRRQQQIFSPPIQDRSSCLNHCGPYWGNPVSCYHNPPYVSMGVIGYNIILLQGIHGSGALHDHIPGSGSRSEVVGNTSRCEPALGVRDGGERRRASAEWSGVSGSSVQPPGACHGRNGMEEKGEPHYDRREIAWLCEGLPDGGQVVFEYIMAAENVSPYVPLSGPSGLP